LNSSETSLLLEGGAEFGGQMRAPDLWALQLAGGPQAAVRVIPTAAAPDNNHARAGENGARWFKSLGATDARWLALIDRSSANDAKIAEELRQARLIYLLGGFTGYLGQTLLGSSAWQAAVEANMSGAVIAGSSAGAMVMCQFYYDPGAGKVQPGLNLIPNALVLPHHNTFGKGWAARLVEQLAGVSLLGIDERTGMAREAGSLQWQVLGQGSVTVYRRGGREVYPAGEQFSL
jgi:cyanophycinase